MFPPDSFAFTLIYLFKEYPFNVHNVTAEKKTSKNLLDVVKPDITTITTVYGVKLVGWCCDSGGDSRGLRRLLLAEMPWLVVLECWAHQVSTYSILIQIILKLR